MNLFALKDVLKVSHGYSLLYTKFEQNDLDQNEFSRNSESQSHFKWKVCSLFRWKSFERKVKNVSLF